MTRSVKEVVKQPVPLSLMGNNGVSLFKVFVPTMKLHNFGQQVVCTGQCTKTVQNSTHDVPNLE